MLLSNDAIQQMIPSVGLRLKFESAFAELVPTCETSKLPRSGTSDDVEEVDQCKATEKPNENLLIDTINLKESVVKEHSKIFGYNKEAAQLTDWQLAVNSCAFELAKEAPSLLYERSKLKEMAEEKARETYIFKKKSGSRSGKLQEEPKAKRMKYSQDERREKIAELSSEIEMVKQRITTKPNLISHASSMKEYLASSASTGQNSTSSKKTTTVDMKVQVIDTISAARSTASVNEANTIDDSRGAELIKKASPEDDIMEINVLKDQKQNESTEAVSGTRDRLEEISRGTELIEQASPEDDDMKSKTVKDQKENESTEAASGTDERLKEISKDQSKLEKQDVFGSPANNESFLALKKRPSCIQQLDVGENEQNLDNLERLIRVLKREEKRNLNNVEQQKIEEGVRESQFEELNLAEYVIAKETYCHLCHQDCRQGCNEMITAAKIVLEEKQVALPTLWRRAVPKISYDCEKAQRRLLQMPVSSLRFAEGCFIVEKKGQGLYDDMKCEICTKLKLSKGLSNKTAQKPNSMQEFTAS